MSYRYGLNGNDLRWDYMPHNWTCVDCDAYIKEARRTQWPVDLEQMECDGHTHKYTFGRGYGYVLHDTNGNFVRVVGNVPLDIFKTDYLAERVNDSTPEPEARRILSELACKSRSDDFAGFWSGHVVCIFTDGDGAVIRVNDKCYLLECQHETPADENDDFRAYVEPPKLETRLYFDECLRV